MTSGQRGLQGEQLAAEHLKQHQYTILQQNYRTRFGEIDIIAQNQQFLVFVEVKTRSGQGLAAPREWVDDTKQKKLIRAAQSYLQAIGSEDFFIRFDVIEIIYSKDEKATLQWIEDAFTVS